MNIIKSEDIRRKLSYIKSIVEDDTKQKLYDINKTAEDIFMHLLNDLYGWQLVNANDIKSNFPAIDLIDTDNEIVIQVTSSIDDSKVVSTIEKFVKFSDDTYKNGAYKQYADYDLKMFYIKEKPDKFSKATQTKIDNQGMSDDDFLGIEDINTKVSANPNIAQKVFKTLCKLLHDKACESDISSQLTTKLGKSTLIGREKELQEIDERLKASKTLLVKGIGGVGKSTIASYYLHSQKDKLDYYGFFEGVESFISELREPLDLKQEKQQDAFMEALAKLRKLEGEKLLVIDDVKNIEENQEHIERILELKNSGYKILLTSREEIEDVEQYYLDVLSMDDAKRLFNSIYEVEDEVLLEEILNYLDCHAFFVEMTAKTLKSKKTLTPELIKEKFENGEFSTIRRKRKESFNDYLNELFSFDGLEDEEILVLKRFSALPSIVDFEFLFYIISDMKDIIEFEEVLNYLVEKGWLINHEKNYKLHQIVKEYIIQYSTPTFKEIEKIYDIHIDCLTRSTSITDVIKTQNNYIFYEEFFKTLDNLNMQNEKVVIYCNQLSAFYGHLEEIEAQEFLLNKALDIKVNILHQNDCDTSVIYNNLADLYKSKGLYLKAEESYQMSLKIYQNISKECLVINDIKIYNELANLYIAMDRMNEAEDILVKILKDRKKRFGNMNDLTIKSYANLGRFYMGIDMKKEELYLKKALEYSIKLYGDSSLVTAERYSALAITYRSQNNYKKAEELIFKVLKIEKDIVEEESYEISYTYGALGDLYLDMEEYNKAEKYYKKDLLIKEKLFGENHSEIADIYDSLATFYKEKEDYNNAEMAYNKALNILIDIWGEMHPDVAEVYDSLALFYQETNDIDKEEIAYLKTLEIQIEMLGYEHSDTITTILQLATFYNEKGENYNKAEEYYLKALKLKEKKFGTNHIDIAVIYVDLGWLYLDLNDFKKSKKYLFNSLTIQKNLNDVNYWEDLAVTYIAISLFYERKKDFKKAFEYQEEVVKLNQTYLTKDDPVLLESIEYLESIKEEF